MEQVIGQKLLAEVKGLADNFNLVEDKIGVYSFTTRGLHATLVAVPGEEIGINLESIDSGNPLLFYSMDNDLYKLNDPENYDANKDVEDEIVAIVKALKGERIVIGERKGRKAFVLPLRDTVRLVYQGRFAISSKDYRDYKELLAKDKFIPDTNN